MDNCRRRCCTFLLRNTHTVSSQRFPVSEVLPYGYRASSIIESLQPFSSFSLVLIFMRNFQISSQTSFKDEWLLSWLLHFPSPPHTHIPSVTRAFEFLRSSLMDTELHRFLIFFIHFYSSSSFSSGTCKFLHKLHSKVDDCCRRRCISFPFLSVSQQSFGASEAVLLPYGYRAASLFNPRTCIHSTLPSLSWPHM